MKEKYYKVALEPDMDNNSPGRLSETGGKRTSVVPLPIETPKPAPQLNERPPTSELVISEEPSNLTHGRLNSEDSIMGNLVSAMNADKMEPT